jgi:succinoglycan biosynthesis transport protein ExoP
MTDSRSDSSTAPLNLPTPMSDQGQQKNGAVVPADGLLTGKSRSSSLPPAMSKAPTAAALLAALGQRWLMATILGLLASVLAAVAVWYFVPVKYKAQAIVKISSREKGIFQDQLVADFANYQKTQAALLKSRFVLNAALRPPSISELSIIKRQSDPVEWLESALVTDFSLSPELLRVTLSADNPQELKALLDAVLSAYKDEVIQYDDDIRKDRAAKIRDAATRYSDTLRRKRRDYNELAEKVGSNNPFVIMFKQHFAQERLSSMQKRAHSAPIGNPQNAARNQFSRCTRKTR